MTLLRNLVAGFVLCVMVVIGGAMMSATGGPVLGGAASAAQAEPTRAVNVQATEVAWRDWMARRGVTQSSIAIGQGGDILHSSGQMRSPDPPYAMASLSKAVTGMCLNQLLAQSPYGWNSTLADLAPECAKMNLTPAPPCVNLKTLARAAAISTQTPITRSWGS